MWDDYKTKVESFWHSSYASYKALSCEQLLAHKKQTWQKIEDEIEMHQTKQKLAHLKCQTEELLQLVLLAEYVNIWPTQK